MGLLMGMLISIVLGKTGVGSRVADLDMGERARFTKELVMDPNAGWVVRAATGTLAASLVLTTLPLPLKFSQRFMLAGVAAAASFALAKTITPERMDEALLMAREPNGASLPL